MATKIYAKYEIANPFKKGEVIKHCDPVELLANGNIKDCRGKEHEVFVQVTEKDYIKGLDAMFAFEAKRGRNRRGAC